MNIEYPTEYYVTETFPLANGGSVTDFAAGPFDEPDQAKSVRAEMLKDDPVRNLQCTQYTYLDGGPHYD